MGETSTNSAEPKIRDEIDGVDEYIQKNPLFVDVVLENILSFLKENNKSSTLGEYRLVCKFWDQAIIKLIRRETQIDIYRILAPYPSGFGWTTSRGNFKYDLPYQQVYPFENVKRTETYIILTGNGPLYWTRYRPSDEKVETWFRLMGHQVRSLEFSCLYPVSPKGDHRLLEKILKEWCPNLERLKLTHIKSLKGLAFTSYFQNYEKEILCKNLKELVIDVYRPKNVCDQSDQIPNILVDPTNLNEFIYNHGSPSQNDEFPEIINGSGTKVVVPKEFDLQTKLPEFSDLIPENFFPKYLDGGVLGQLMKHTKVTTFQLIGYLKPAHLDKLMPLFHYRQNNWKSTLNNLHVDLYEKDKNITKYLLIFAKVGFPITNLKITKSYEKMTELEIKDMTRLLACFSETLKNFEIERFRIPGRYPDEEESDKLLLPFLPKLKILVLDGVHLAPLSAVNLVTKAPNLEKCHLKAQKRFYSNTRNLDGFFEGNSPTASNNQLKDFKLVAEYVRFSAVQASKLLEWYPKLERVELIGMVDDNIGMIRFIQQLGSLEVKHLKISWSTGGNVKTRNNINDSAALIQEIGKLQSLISLEMTCAYDKLNMMPTALRVGFGQLTIFQLPK